MSSWLARRKVMGMPDEPGICSVRRANNNNNNTWASAAGGRYWPKKPVQGSGELGDRPHGDSLQQFPRFGYWRMRPALAAGEHRVKRMWADGACLFPVAAFMLTLRHRMTVDVSFHPAGTTV